MTNERLLNREKIKKRIEEIKEAMGDNERAHVLEDRLYRDFIYSISIYLEDDLGELAQLVLSAWELDYVRWYA